MPQQKCGHFGQVSSFLAEEQDEGEKELLMTKALKEVEEGPNEGEMLMIKRALSGLVS